MYEDTLQILRLIKGYKQEEIAEVLNLPENLYSVLELTSQKITIGQAKVLAEFYNMDLEDVLPRKTVTGDKTERVTQAYTELISLMNKKTDFLMELNMQLLQLLREQQSPK
jgi:transcriptional regulator with XRE-family HTH domain